MNKYLVFRCGKCIWKNTKSHELIGVEMAEDIDDVFEDIQQDILDDLKGMKDYSYPVYRVEADYIDGAADTDIHVYSIDEVFIDAIQANMIIRCLELSNPKEPLRKITPAGTG